MEPNGNFFKYKLEGPEEEKTELSWATWAELLPLLVGLK